MKLTIIELQSLFTFHGLLHQRQRRAKCHHCAIVLKDECRHSIRSPMVDSQVPTAVEQSKSEDDPSHSCLTLTRIQYDPDVKLLRVFVGLHE